MTFTPAIEFMLQKIVRNVATTDEIAQMINAKKRSWLMIKKAENMINMLFFFVDSNLQ